MEKAKKMAQGKDVRIGGGVQIVREYLKLKLIDEIHLAMAPTLLGCGEHLFNEIDLVQLGYQSHHVEATPKATHFLIKKIV